MNRAYSGLVVDGVFYRAVKLMALNVDKMNGRVMQKKLLFILPSSFFLAKEWGPCHFFKPNSTK